MDLLRRLRSPFVKGTAIAYMAFPLSYVVFVAIFFDVPARNWPHIVFNFFFFTLSILAMITGFCLWEMRRWSWYLFLPTNSLIVLENALVIVKWADTNHGVLTFLVSTIAMTFIVYRMMKVFRVPYISPRIAWWETNPKIGTHIDVALRNRKQAETAGVIMDIGTAGCFIRTNDSYKLGERLFLRFNLMGHLMEISGRVVWLADQAVTHPRGIGVRFRVDRRTRRRLRVVIRRLDRLNRMNRKTSALPA